MKKRLLALSVIAVALTTLGLAAPAQAAQFPGYVEQGAYNWNEQCQDIGYNGAQNHTWKYYYCDAISPSSWDGPGLYILYVAY